MGKLRKWFLYIWNVVPKSAFWKGKDVQNIEVTDDSGLYKIVLWITEYDWIYWLFDVVPFWLGIYLGLANPLARSIGLWSFPYWTAPIAIPLVAWAYYFFIKWIDQIPPYTYLFRQLFGRATILTNCPAAIIPSLMTVETFSAEVDIKAEASDDPETLFDRIDTFMTYYPEGEEPPNQNGENGEPPAEEEDEEIEPSAPPKEDLEAKKEKFKKIIDSEDASEHVKEEARRRMDALIMGGKETTRVSVNASYVVRLDLKEAPRIIAAYLKAKQKMKQHIEIDEWILRTHFPLINRGVARRLQKENVRLMKEDPETVSDSVKKKVQERVLAPLGLKLVTLVLSEPGGSYFDAKTETSQRQQELNRDNEIARSERESEEYRAYQAMLASTAQLEAERQIAIMDIFATTGKQPKKGGVIEARKNRELSLVQDIVAQALAVKNIDRETFLKTELKRMSPDQLRGMVEAIRQNVPQTLLTVGSPTSENLYPLPPLLQKLVEIGTQLLGNEAAA